MCPIDFIFIVLVNLLIGYKFGKKIQKKKLITQPPNLVPAQSYVSISPFILPNKSPKELEIEKVYYLHRALTMRSLH